MLHRPYLDCKVRLYLFYEDAKVLISYGAAKPINCAWMAYTTEIEARVWRVF